MTNRIWPFGPSKLEIWYEDTPDMGFEFPRSSGSLLLLHLRNDRLQHALVHLVGLAGLRAKPKRCGAEKRVGDSTPYVWRMLKPFLVKRPLCSAKSKAGPAAAADRAFSRIFFVGLI